MNDIHTHLYWESYDTDRDAVIARAHAAGIDQLFTVGCTVEESRQCVALAEQYPEIFASVGIHPQEFFDESGILNLESWMHQLRALAKNTKVIAIGECGLEYFVRSPSGAPVSVEQMEWQKKAFLAQIALADELNLPLIVHCRPSTGTQDSYEDLVSILRDSRFKNQDSSIILHCYMGDTEVTEKFLTLPNVYFSFTGNITYPVKKVVAGTKDDLTETVKMIPLDRIFTETDCPFLTPQSHRGERNEPAYVAEVLECIARLHGVEPKGVEELTESNFKKLFPMVQ